MNTSSSKAHTNDEPPDDDHSTSTGSDIADKPAHGAGNDTDRSRGRTDVQKAVDFAKLLANSSLGTAEAQEDRLTGRREISRLEAEHAVFTRALSGPRGIDDHEFDLEVADELDLSNHTFEAELRYRAVTSSMIAELGSSGLPRRAQIVIRRAAVNLALVLDAKGFGQEALRLYGRASEANDANAAWRLAVISRQAGRTELAGQFARLATAAMSGADQNALRQTVRRLHKHRHHVDIGRILDTESFRASSTDAAFAVGSALFVVSGRRDLAGLAYCSALSRGHSLAAVTLLDLPYLPVRCRRSTEIALGEIVETGVLRRVRTGRHSGLGGAKTRRFLQELESEMADEPFSRLVALSRARPRHPVGNRALARVLLLARSTTVLRWFIRIGCDTASPELVHCVSNRVSNEIAATIRNDRSLHAPAILAHVWDVVGRELDNVGLRTRTRETSHRIRQSGAVIRYRRAFARLPDDHRRIIALRVCGVTEDDIAAASTPVAAISSGAGVVPQPRMTIAQVHDVFTAGASRLRYEQRGEQYDPVLWEDVNSAFPVELAQKLKDLMGSGLRGGGR